MMCCISTLQENQSRNLRLEIYEVGGSQSERRKWGAILEEDINLYIYVISLVGYDGVCFENSNATQMSEALQLFQSTTHMHNNCLKPI